MRRNLLQIIHYSDVHVIESSYYYNGRWRQFLLNKHLPAQWKQGINGADKDALFQFERFLKHEIATDPDWNALPTWLVDSGDGTTFGDDSSLTEWLNWSARFQNAVPWSELIQLYGNHDAWPGYYPLFASAQTIDNEIQRLRRNWFKNTWPTSPLSVAISKESSIQLYVLNSVDHRKTKNWLAQGNALPDRFWESPPGTRGPTAAKDLERAVNGATTKDDHHLRILVMHYPICDAALPNSIQEILQNRANLASDLVAGNLNKAVNPLAHICLSGHTHVLFPNLGLMPNSAACVKHSPLIPGQCQFVVGSLAQKVTASAKPLPDATYYEQCAMRFPYQSQILRFSIDTANPREILIDRLIAARPQRGGQFGFLPIAKGSHRYSETMSVVI